MIKSAFRNLGLKVFVTLFLCIFAFSSVLMATPKKKTSEELKKDLEAIKKSLDKDKKAPRWLRIEVKDLEEGAVVKVNLPLKAVIAFLEAGLEIAEEQAKIEMKKHKKQGKHEKDEIDEEHIRQSVLSGFEFLKKYPIEQWIEWFKEVPNGEIVTVDSKDAKVRIWVE